MRQAEKTNTIENEGRSLEVCYTSEFDGWDTEIDIKAIFIGEEEFTSKDFSPRFIKSLTHDIIAFEMQDKQNNLDYQAEMLGDESRGN